MDALEVTKLQLEAWKTTIEVQRHFNDIEMKIRALAITVLTAVLGAAAVAIKDGTKLDLFGAEVPLGSAILFIGVVTWLLFYGVDQVWYHRLLLGSVYHGHALEAILSAHGPGFGLTKAISEASPYQVKLPFIGNVGAPIHSTAKLRTFYWGVAGLLVAATVLTAFGTISPASPAK